MITRIFSFFEVATVIVVLTFVLLHLVRTLYRALRDVERK